MVGSRDDWLAGLRRGGGWAGLRWWSVRMGRDKFANTDRGLINWVKGEAEGLQ